MTKVIIIVWHWGKQYLKKDKIDDMDLSSRADWLSHPEQHRGELYEEFEVQHSPKTKHGYVVAANIWKGVQTNLLLDALIRLYSKKETEIMVFLHRTNGGFDGEDVLRVLEQNRQVKKCMLFSDGKDYIYHRVLKQGLLDTVNGFQMSGVKTADITCKQVLQPYFDNVWEYYSLECKRKLFTLRQDLLDAMLPFCHPDSSNEFSSKDFQKKIYKDKVLMYRVKSFMGYFDEKYDDRKQEKIEEEKEAFQKIDQTLNLDDCIANLQQHDDQEERNIKASYLKTVEQLELFFPFGKGKQKVKPLLSKEDIRTLRDVFGNLIDIIPGRL